MIDSHNNRVELAFHNIFDSVHFYKFFYPQNRKIESRLFQAFGIALSIETDFKNGPTANAIKRIEIRCLRFDGTNDITTISDVNLTKKARNCDKNLQSKIMNLK